MTSDSNEYYEAVAIRGETTSINTIQIGNSTIPPGASNCIVLGNDIHLTKDDLIQDVLYIGSSTTFVHADHRCVQLILNIEKLLNGYIDSSLQPPQHGSEITNTPIDTFLTTVKTVKTVMVGVGKQRFIDLERSIADLQEKLDHVLSQQQSLLQQQHDSSAIAIPSLPSNSS